MPRHNQSAPPIDPAPTRPALSRELILHTAMGTLQGSPQPLSLAKVGRRLGVDPTAVYRHYRNRDELLRSLGDEIYRETWETVGPTLWERPWRQMMSDWWWAVRRTYLRYPALALEVAPRFTGGEYERLSSIHSRNALRDLGLDATMAARYTRAVAETALGFIVITARLVTLPTELQVLDTEIGHRVYPEGVHDEIPLLQSAIQDEEEIFALALQTQLDGLAAAADRIVPTATPRKGRATARPAPGTTTGTKALS